MNNPIWQTEAGAHGIGPRDLWERRADWIGVLCSRRVPASLILAAQDWANQYCTTPSGILVSGWQSPLEQEILRVALREHAAVIGVAARQLDGARLPQTWQGAVNKNTMTVISPFDDAARLTRARAVQRNRWILQNCPRIIIPHATPGGALHQLLMETLAKPNAPRITVFDHPTHEMLLTCGARKIEITGVSI